MPGLETLLTRLKLDCDIIILTECWLSRTSVIPNLPGYRFEITKNNPKQNDGVVIYFREHLRLKVIEPNVEECNCLVATYDNRTAIIAMYRSPSFYNLDPFLKSLDEVLTKYSSFENVIVMGDTNIAINHNKLEVNGERYLTLAASHGLLPAHTLITRSESETCIDHALLKTKSPAITIVPDSTLTDHYPVLLNLNFKKTTQFSLTSIKKVDTKSLEQDILNINLNPIYDSPNPNDSLFYLTNSLQQAIVNNTKVVTLPRRKKIIKPWITQGLLRCMRNRDKMHRKYKLSPDNLTLKITYTRYRNFCNNLLKKVKRAYEKDKVRAAQTDSKRLWKAIKEITNTSKNTNHPNELLSLSTTPQSSLNEINRYFVNVGKTLADRVGQRKASNTPASSSFQTLTQINSFVLEGTTEVEVDRLILNLKPDCATGYDSISSSFLQTYKNFLVPPLTFIFNSCLQHGVFPDSLKKSVICPIHKSGDRSRIINYRPISILPAISKLLERIINTRLVGYLESKHLLSTNQYGFREGKSTDQAVNDLINFVSNNLDKKQKSLTVFLDLAKAFDTISVPILLKKLELLGIRGTQLKLFESYLTGRVQSVRIGNVNSGDLPVTYGVPQGSILGPTLFLVYINDLTSLKLRHGKIISFADDTALAFSANTWQGAFKAAQDGFNAVSEWLEDNGLTLNVDKTKYVCFSIRSNTEINLDQHNIIAHECPSRENCSCPTLKRVSLIKYLGVIIDQNLNFKEHCKALCGRIRKLIYIFKTLRHVTEPFVLKRIYFALCQSLITYCISSWGGSPKTTIKPVEVAQRAILKVSTFKPRLFPTSQLYEFCEVLTVRQLFLLNIVLMQHKNIFYNPLTQNKRTKHLVCPQLTASRTKFSNRFVPFIGPYIYNKINKNLNIYPMTKKSCKITVSEYLQKLTYEETENLLQIPT